MSIIFEPFTGQIIDTGSNISTTSIGGPVSGADPNSVLVVDGASTLQDITMPIDGQLLIGSAGNLPVASTLTQASASQVVITNGPGSITLGLPQDISSSDSPTFAGLTLTGFSGPVKATAGILSASAIDLASSEVTNILTTDKGGTGLNGSAAPNGHILIGNGSGYTLADILGTTNQVNISNGAGSIQLSLPQDIDSGASPEFFDLFLAGTMDVAILGGTLGIGTNKASVINIGSPTATVNIQGTTIYQNVTNLNVADKNITVNVGGLAGSGGGAGIHVEEAGVSNAGHVEVTGDRLGWELHPPGVPGIAYIYPGASGITIDQSSHDPVTIATPANGLGILNQELSIELSSASSTGALSSTDWNTFNSKQDSISATAPITFVSNVVGITQSGSSQDGYLSSIDWNTFNNKQDSLTFGSISSSTTGISIVNGSNSTVGPNVTIDIDTADSTHTGLLSSSDWTTFNNKQTALTFGSISTSTTGVSIVNGSNSTVGPNVTVDIDTANSTQSGLLSSSDWNSFSNKVDRAGDTMTGSLIMETSPSIQTSISTSIISADQSFEIKSGAGAHNLNLTTSDNPSGVSGDVIISTGDVTGSNYAGSIYLTGGSNVNGNPANIVLTAGVSSGSGSSGSIVLDAANIVYLNQNLSGSISAGTDLLNLKRIQNVANPVSNQDAATMVWTKNLSSFNNIRYVSPTGSIFTGNGSLFDPYDSIATALSVSADGDLIALLPGTYNEPTVVIPSTLSNINFSGMLSGSTVVSNGFSYTPPATSINIQFNQIAIQQLTINAASAINGLIEITRCQFSLNRSDTNGNVLIKASESSIFGGTINSTFNATECLFVVSADVYSGLSIFENCKYVSRIEAHGNCIVRMLDCELFGATEFINGTVVGIDTPTWQVDLSTEYLGGYTGSITKVLLANINSILPSQSGNSGKFLKTDGSNISWDTPAGGGGGQPLTFDTVTNVGLTATSPSYDGSVAVTLGIDNTIVATLSDSQILTNKTIDASSNTLSNIPNSSLVNSSITINGTPVSLGGSTTVSASIANLTVGTGLQLDSGTVFDGTVAKTISIDSSVATLTDSQTLTNKTLTNPIVTNLYVDNITGYPSTLSLNTLSSTGPSGFNTSNISIQTGAQSIGGYNTGNVSITTGNAIDILAVSSGTSGNVAISTGNSADQTAGNIVLSTGTGNPGGVAIRGDIELSAENIILKDSSASLIGTIDNVGITLESSKSLILKQTTTQISIGAEAGGSGSYSIALPKNAPSQSNTTLVYDGAGYKWDNLNGFIPPINSAEVKRSITPINSTTTPLNLGLGVAATQYTLNGTSASVAADTSSTRGRITRGRINSSNLASTEASIVYLTFPYSITGGFRMRVGFGFGDASFNNSARSFYGLVTSTFSPISSGVPSNNTNIIGVGSDSTDTNLQIMYNDAAGTATKIDLGSNFPANRTAVAASTDWYVFELYNGVSSNSVLYKIQNLKNGATAQGTLTTNLPASSVSLAPHIGRGTGSNAITVSLEYSELAMWNLG